MVIVCFCCPLDGAVVSPSGRRVVAWIDRQMATKRTMAKGLFVQNSYSQLQSTFLERLQYFIFIIFTLTVSKD